LLVKDDVESYHRQFMFIAPEQVPLQAPQDPVDAEVGTTPAHSFGGSDTTELNTDNKACEAAELAKPVWTGYYTFSLAILPRKEAARWKIGSGRFGRRADEHGGV